MAMCAPIHMNYIFSISEACSGRPLIYKQIHNYILFHVRSPSFDTVLNATFSWMNNVNNAMWLACARVAYLPNEDVDSRSQVNGGKMKWASVNVNRNNCALNEGRNESSWYAHVGTVGWERCDGIRIFICHTIDRRAHPPRALCKRSAQEMECVHANIKRIQFARRTNNAC